MKRGEWKKPFYELIRRVIGLRSGGQEHGPRIVALSRVKESDGIHRVPDWTKNPDYLLNQLLLRIAEIIDETENTDEIFNKIEIEVAGFMNQYPEIEVIRFIREIKLEELLDEMAFVEKELPGASIKTLIFRVSFRASVLKALEFEK
jgi:hypothetical protein